MPRFSLRNPFPAGYLAGMIAGAAVGFTRLHPEWAPLQIPALALFGWALSREKGFWGGLRPGVGFGVALAGVALAKIRVDAASTTILFVALALYWMALASGLAFFLRRKTFAGIWAAAGLLTFGEWAQAHVLPLFGTAQRIAAAWVDFPETLFLSRLGGTTLVAFAVALVAFLISRCFPAAENRNDTYRVVFTTRPLLPAAAFAGAVLSLGWILWLGSENESRGFPVAVCGTKSRESAFLSPDLFWKKYGPMIGEAAAQGAKLVVTPELALDVVPENRDAALAGFAAEAKRLNIVWILGFSEGGRARSGSLNRSVILNAARPVGAIYDKTHWVKFMERYAKTGDARPPVATGPGDIRVGTMICQDDNFEDVSRSLSLSGADIVGVPTFDWPGVAEAHLDSARNRPREFGFVEARAAIGGISAIIDPAGRVLASRNHLTEGDGIALAQVQIGAGGPTLFARFGDWPALLVAAAGVVAGLVAGRKPGREMNPGGA